MLDFSAVYWKELKDLLQGKKRVFSGLLFVIAISVWLPLQLFHNWVQLPLLGMLSLLAIPLMIVLSFVADAFAGERERHTLESLLATRLSNWSIVVGKGVALITFAWGMMVISLIASLVVANVLAGKPSWSFYPLDRLLTVLLLSPIVSVPIIAIGILISLRVATVRQAQQTLSYGLIGLGAIVSFLLSQIARLPFSSHLPAFSYIQILLVFSAVTLIIDIALVALVLALFRRSRLLWN